MNSKAIKKQVFVALTVVLESPINVTGTDSELTDKDLIRDGEGRPFIPGTSIAGVFRNYLHNARVENEADKLLMGDSDESNGHMSALYISDLYFTKANILIRDGVCLTEDKVAADTGKYDMEVIETGAKGTLYLQYTLRDESDDELFSKLIKELIAAVQRGDIRFGARKNRGYGRLDIEKIYRKEFTRESLESYLSFERSDLSLYDAPMTEWKDNSSEQYLKISVPLKLTGGISIRKYSTKPNEADFEQITVNSEAPLPVIPGTSWNGAIRADAKRILRELGIRTVSSLIDQWFGNAEKKNAVQSQVVISESQIQSSIPLVMVRNQIDRFDAATVGGALYTERSYFTGTTKLELLVRKKEDFKALTGLLLLIIQDIQSGYVAVGGQTAIGRGIFAGNGKVVLSEGTEDEYNKALYDVIFGGAK